VRIPLLTSDAIAWNQPWLNTVYRTDRPSWIVFGLTSSGLDEVESGPRDGSLHWLMARKAGKKTCTTQGRRRINDV
jgi:hypothetical protein